MKTIVDVSAFLKRTGSCLVVSFDAKSERFDVRADGGNAHTSKYLDDALENLAESMRRSANAMTPVRETKPVNKTPAVRLPGYATSVTVTAGVSPPSISQAAQQAYQQSTGPQINGAVPSCPACGQLPDYMTGAVFERVICKGMHTWPAADGLVYVFENGERYTYHANGSWLNSKWIKQP